MSTKNGLLDGGKFNGRHTTLIKEAEIVVAAAKAHGQVTKIVLAIITSVPGGPRRLKVKPVPAGLEVSVRGMGAMQKLFVYTADALGVTAKLEEVWKKNYD